MTGQPWPQWLIDARARERALIKTGRRRALTRTETDELNRLRVKMNGPTGVRKKKRDTRKPDAPLGQVTYSGTVSGGLPGLGKN